MEPGLSARTGWGIAILVITGVILLQLPHLALPYYWDEAWSYGPAVCKMVEHGPSLLPGSIDAVQSRGHPLLFYFLAACWLHVFPDNLFFSHVFALVVSVLFLLVFYGFAKKIFGTDIALASLIILSVQGLFLSHASLLLPEILLGLLTLLACCFYFSGKKALFSICAACLLLCKETGIALVAAIFLLEVYNHIVGRKPIKELINRTLSLFGLTLIAMVVFYSIQKRQFGWFLFPGHVQLISFSPSVVWGTITSYGAYLFLYLGHNILTLAMIAPMIIWFIRPTGDTGTGKILVLFLLFAILYLLVLGINFYTTRYILCLLPFYILTAVYFIFSSFKRFRKIVWAGFVVFAGVTLFYSYTPNRKGNAIAYMDDIRVQKQAVGYLEKMDLFNKPIATHFLMKVNLTDPVPGYLSSERKFSRVQDAIDSTTEYVVLSSQEENPVIKEKVEENKRLPEAVFRVGKSWCSIYKLKTRP